MSDRVVSEHFKSPFHPYKATDSSGVGVYSTPLYDVTEDRVHGDEPKLDWLKRVDRIDHIYVARYEIVSVEEWRRDGTWVKVSDAR